MEMETEVGRKTHREDKVKEGQETNDHDDRKAREEDAIGTKQTQPSRPCTHETAMEDMELREEGT
jgi:hypothetical protein